MARLAYLGTPELAVPPMLALLEAGHHIDPVVTRPDRRRSRGGAPSPSPVKAVALDRGLRVTDRLEELQNADAELGVVVAFGRIVPAAVLARLPMVNLHFSLLPRWRGAAPVERAILAGDEVTGVCVMAVEEGLDTGGIHARREVRIEPDDDLQSLRERLVGIGSHLLVEVLAGGSAGLSDPEPQVGEATYAGKIDPSELEIDWRRPAVEIDRLVRLGRAWTTFRGRRLRVLGARVVAGGADTTPGTLDGDTVAAGGGAVELKTVQPEGRQPMEVGAWRRGARPEPGDRLGR